MELRIQILKVVCRRLVYSFRAYVSNSGDAANNIGATIPAHNTNNNSKLTQL